MPARTVLVALLASLVTATPVASQDLEKKTEDSEAVKLARELGSLGGAAQWCKLDPAVLEEFNAWADIKVAVVADGEYDKVSAKIRLNDSRMIASTKEPSLDCKMVERQIAQKQAEDRL